MWVVEKLKRRTKEPGARSTRANTSHITLIPSFFFLESYFILECVNNENEKQIAAGSIAYLRKLLLPPTGLFGLSIRRANIEANVERSMPGWEVEYPLLLSVMRYPAWSGPTAACIDWKFILPACDLAPIVCFGPFFGRNRLSRGWVSRDL